MGWLWGWGGARWVLSWGGVPGGARRVLSSGGLPKNGGVPNLGGVPGGVPGGAQRVLSSGRLPKNGGVPNFGGVPGGARRVLSSGGLPNLGGVPGGVRGGSRRALSSGVPGRGVGGLSGLPLILGGVPGRFPPPNLGGVPGGVPGGSPRTLSSGIPEGGGKGLPGVSPGLGGGPDLGGGVLPFEALPCDGGNRWVNLLRAWGGGGLQLFHRRMERAFQRLGPVYRERVGSWDSVNVLLPRDAAQLLRTEGPFPRRRGLEAWSTHRRLRNHPPGLFLLNGPAWRGARAALNPLVLSPAGARKLLPLLDAVARDFARALRQRVRREPGRALTLDPHPLLFRFTLEASSYALYGERLGLVGGGSGGGGVPPVAAGGGAQRFLGAVEAMLRTTLPLLFVPPPLMRRLHPPLWREHLRAWDLIFQHADQNIQRIYREFCRGGVPGGLLAELLLGGQLPLGAIKANVTEFTAGGVDTTAVPLLFALFELGRNPGVQRALREELRAAEGGAGIGAGGGQDEETPPPLHELLGALPLLRAAIKETLRLYPVGITVQRYPTTDVVLDKYRVPAGTLCQVSLYAMGRSPEVFPHPLRYDPSRWLGREDTSFKALAFGFGARQCIGRRLAEAEMMLFLAHVLRAFTVEAVSSEDIPTVFRFILMPETSPLLTFRTID